MGLWFSLLFGFIISTLLEIAVACAMKYRSRKDLLAVLLVNLITQPTLNYLLFFSHRFNLMKIDFSEICVLEAIITLIEWKLLAYALDRKSSEIFLLSLAMNTTSFLTGYLLQFFLK